MTRARRWAGAAWASMSMSVSISVAVGVAAVVAGCGVTKDAQSRPLRPIPFGLADPTTTSSSTIAPATTTTLAPTTVTLAPTTTTPTYPVTIYLVDATGHLLAVTRTLPEPVNGVAGLMKPLLDGTTSGDSAGVRSVATANVFTGARKTEGGTAFIDVGPGYADLDAAQAALATAQLVFTVTELPGVGRVRLVSGDETINAVRADGTQSSDEVSRDDYRALARSA